MSTTIRMRLVHEHPPQAEPPSPFAPIACCSTGPTSTHIPPTSSRSLPPQPSPLFPTTKQISLPNPINASLPSRIAPKAHVPMLFVMLLLPLSTALVLLSLTTLPITVSWPRTLPDLAQLGRELLGYSQSGPAQMAHVIAVLSITAVWKHAWSFPGSVVWNVLSGALFSPAFATILMTTLTTLGSACATLLAMPLGPLVTRFFPKALDITRHALEGDSDATSSSDADGGVSEKPRSSTWVRLSVLRLVGVVPWSGINIACGVCGVSIWDCMLSTFIGCLPWTAVTCQIGDILQTVASHPSPTPQTVSSLLTSPAIIVKLVVLSFLSLAPILGRDYLRALIAHDESATLPAAVSAGEEKRASRWAVSWVQDWRTKIRKVSRSRTREASEHELHVLVDEKRAIEDLAS
ncbi:snare associated Golgi protein-domain-containing protein [Mycena maculata]|uniref:Snare associated Golgi protein-domain-containing protein n=1 Tax=Mycena maculata TaxID=230809 RepID=A0AAD7J289_9AGAR|nr:snare associated Golgi protein-domain-containing protein [Mycena maculata]